MPEEKPLASKASIDCGLPSSATLKSSRVKPRTGEPCWSMTTTSSTTRRTVVLRTVGTSSGAAGVFRAGGICACIAVAGTDVNRRAQSIARNRLSIVGLNFTTSEYVPGEESLHGRSEVEGIQCGFRLALAIGLRTRQEDMGIATWPQQEHRRDPERNILGHDFDDVDVTLRCYHHRVRNQQRRSPAHNPNDHADGQSRLPTRKSQRKNDWQDCQRHNEAARPLVGPEPYAHCTRLLHGMWIVLVGEEVKCNTAKNLVIDDVGQAGQQNQQGHNWARTVDRRIAAGLGHFQRLSQSHHDDSREDIHDDSATCTGQYLRSHLGKEDNCFREGAASPRY